MRESINLRNIDRNLALNLVVIFNCFTDISFLKDVTKIFYISYYFQECFQNYFGSVRYSFQWLRLNILSNKGANQLQVLFKSTLGNKLLKLGSSNVSPKIIFLKSCRSFRIKSKELLLENYVLEYHTADKDHAEVLQNCVPLFF